MWLQAFVSSNLSSLIQGDWPAMAVHSGSPPVFPNSPSPTPVLGSQVHMATPDFHAGIGDLNSDTHAYVAGTLLTEPSP